MDVIQVLHIRGTTSERRVGGFICHPTHAHWRRRLRRVPAWSLSPTAALLEVVASSEKVSYCMIDTDLVAPQLEGVVETRQYADAAACARDCRSVGPIPTLLTSTDRNWI
jgi:hypothetical protein